MGRLLAFVYGPMAVGIWWAVERGLLWPADHHACVLLERTGVACPTCGGVRAALAFGRGDPAGAFLQNPLVALGLVVLAMWFLWAVVATVRPAWRVVPTPSPGEARVLRIAVVMLVAGTWVYEIIRHR